MNTPQVLNNKTPDRPFLFSICALVNNLQEYAIMKESFEKCGFTDDCEYLLYDNSETNVADAYQAIAGFLKQAKGKYLIIVHQDVRCIDHRSQLVNRLDELTALDEHWAICGNAGCDGYHEQVRYLDNAGKILQDKGLPRKVKSLDENLLIINSQSNITISRDLSGYHLYGTDLCIIADFLGYSAYVIEFMVTHLSSGNPNGFRQGIADFTKSYGRKLRSRYIETTCTKFYLGSSEGGTKVCNTAPVFTFIKAVEIAKRAFKSSK